MHNSQTENTDTPETFYDEYYDQFEADYNVFEQNQIDMDGFYGEYENDFGYDFEE